MREITVYSKSWCPFCQQAKALLARKGLAFDEIDLDAEPRRLAEMIERSGRRTVPQIFIGEQYLGGCDDLFALERAGRLDPLVRGAASEGAPV